MIHNRGRNVSRRYEKKISWLFCFLFCFFKCQIINFLERQKLYDVLEVALQCNPRWTLRMRAKKSEGAYGSITISRKACLIPIE